jgi:PPM family protein phosphatase
MKVHAEGRSHVGRKREGNEDALHIDLELGLYVVSDGMGGHAAGEVASRLAVDTVIERVGEKRDLLLQIERGEEDASQMVAIARAAVADAASAVHQAASAPDGKSGMGCTLTIALVHAGIVAMAHVGDSRMYLWRDGDIDQLSQDHTMAAELVAAGLISTDEAEDHPFAHVLTRAVGTQPAVQVDTLEMELLPGDRLLMCSDGFSNYVPNDEHLRQCLDGADLGALCDDMVAFANDAGGSDNITVLLLEVTDVSDSTQRTTAIEERYEALGSVFLFEDLPLPLLARVMEKCEEQSHDEAAVIVDKGAAIQALMVIIEGRYELRDGDEVLASLGPGDEAGLSTVMRERPAGATMVACEASRLLRLDGRELNGLIRRRPWLGLGLLERLGRRLSRKLETSFAERAGEPTDDTHGERL